MTYYFRTPINRHWFRPRGPDLVLIIVISELLERHPKSKHIRAPAYSRVNC